MSTRHFVHEKHHDLRNCPSSNFISIRDTCRWNHLHSGKYYLPSFDEVSYFIWHITVNIEIKIYVYLIEETRKVEERRAEQKEASVVATAEIIY